VRHSRLRAPHRGVCATVLKYRRTLCARARRGRAGDHCSHDVEVTLTAAAKWWKTGTIGAALAAAVVAMVAPIEPAQANTLLAAALGHNSGSQTPVCLATNVGAIPVLINSIRLFKFDGSQVAEANGGNCSFPGEMFFRVDVSVSGGRRRRCLRSVCDRSGRFGERRQEHSRGALAQRGSDLLSWRPTDPRGFASGNRPDASRSTARESTT
jgi:hypothetical protein